MSWVYVALTAVSTVVSAAGAVRSGQAQEAQAKAAAQAAEYNAQIEQQKATAEGIKTASREDLQRKQVRQLMGKQAAATAESGSNLNGTAGDLFRQSLYDAEMDAMNIRYEGETNRRGLIAQSGLSLYEASASRMAGKEARKSANISAAGSLIGGIGSAAGAYSKGTK